MKPVLDIVLSVLAKIKPSSQPIKYLVFLDENLPAVDLPGSLTLTAKDLGPGSDDKELWESLLQAGEAFAAILIISADHDFAKLSLQHKWDRYKSCEPDSNKVSIEVIDLNQVGKKFLRPLGLKRPVAQSRKRQKVRVIKYVYGQWLDKHEATV